MANKDKANKATETTVAQVENAQVEMVDTATETTEGAQVETVIDPKGYDAFIATLAREKDGVKGYRYATINDLTEWFGKDGKRIRSIIRSYGVNAPIDKNGMAKYTFMINDPFFVTLFDRLSKGTNGARRTKGDDGFYIV